MNRVVSTGLLDIKRSETGSDKLQKPSNEERRNKGLGKACADFESIFIYQLLQTLRKTVPRSGLFSDKSSRWGMYTMMFDQKVAEDLATKGGGIGLQKMLSDQLSAHNKPESGS